MELYDNTTIFHQCIEQAARALQDSAVFALLMEERLRDCNYHTQLHPFCRLINVGEFMVIPHPLMKQRGSFLASDDVDDLATAMYNLKCLVAVWLHFVAQ